MTNSQVNSPRIQTESQTESLWLAASSTAGAAAQPAEALGDRSSVDNNALTRSPSLTEAPFAETAANQKIQLAPFSDRLALRRKLYVPLGDRNPLRALAPLFAGGQLQQVAMGHWHETNKVGGKANQTDSNAAVASPSSSPPSSSQWFMARLVALEALSNSSDEPTSPSATPLQLVPYLHIDLTDCGDLSLRLLPTCRHHLAINIALSTLDGVGREFKIPAQASFIQRLAQLQAMQLELRQEFAIRRSLYQALASTPMKPSQALGYFERLLDESPYPTSRTPASDRLLQRRQLLKTFSSRPNSTHPSPTLWDAYGAVAHWVNCTAPGSSAQRWLSTCHGAGATLLRQALAYAVALQYDQQEAEKELKQSRPSGAQRSLAASDALQARIQQQREPLREGAIALQELENRP